MSVQVRSVVSCSIESLWIARNGTYAGNLAKPNLVTFGRNEEMDQVRLEKFYSQMPVMVISMLHDSIEQQRTRGSQPTERYPTKRTQGKKVYIL